MVHGNCIRRHFISHYRTIHNRPKRLLRRYFSKIAILGCNNCYVNRIHRRWLCCLGPIFTTIFLLLMFFGACAGSTCGGAKIDRLVVLAKIQKWTLQSHTPQCYITRTRKWESHISRNSIQNISIYLSICHGTYSRVYYPIGIGVVYGRIIRFDTFLPQQYRSRGRFNRSGR